VFSFDAVMDEMKEGLGVGYVFLPENGKTGIDLDHCIEQGQIHTRAQEIIQELDSYSEISPSGTGVHILARGSLPGPLRKKDGIEMYDKGRYFAVTGNMLRGTPTTVNQRQAQLGALYYKVFGQESTSNAKVDDVPRDYSPWRALPDAETIRLLCPQLTYLKRGTATSRNKAGMIPPRTSHCVAGWCTTPAATRNARF